MNTNYIKTPIFTTLEDIIEKNYTLSATQYKSLQIKNKNILPLASFLDRQLQQKDLGSEVGSDCYVNNSPFRFIKTKALQEESYLLDITSESVQFITPLNFRDMNLKEGDLLISKDSNVGEIVILDRDYPNTMLCGAIYKLPITKNKYYLLAFIKSNVFRQQIDFLVPRGSTIRHGKTRFLECMIPLPNKNPEETIQYVELLMQVIINKEIEIRKKFELILTIIETEIRENHNENSFVFSYPCIDEILETTRLDSSIYSMEFKKEIFLLNNYKHGTFTIKDLGFIVSRGQNLQITNIGHSIYSDEYKNGFYTLIKPTNISNYGTIPKYEYFGNPNSLICLNKGDLVFGAEGTFRSFVVIDDVENAITNIHGITLNQNNPNLQKGIFIKLLLDYYRSKGIINAYAVGGNGGSLAIKYWDYLKFPNFPDEKQKEITKLYHNPDVTYNPFLCDKKFFTDYNKNYDSNAGIYDLDIAIKYLKKKLDEAIECIINDEEVKLYK